MSVVDASVIASALRPEDVNYQASRAWLRQHIRNQQRVIAPVIILSEIAGAIARRTNDTARGRAAVVDFLTLPRLTLVHVDRTLADRSADLAATLRLRGADAIYVALAASLGVELVTWDREQQERGAQRVETVRPDTPMGRLSVSDPAIYDALAEMIERRLRERHPHRTWHVDRAAELRQAAERSGVPVDYSGVVVEGNSGGVPVRQQVGILEVDTFAAIDDAFIDRIVRHINDQ